MEPFVSNIATSPLLQMLSAVVAAETLGLLGLVVWLAFQTRRQGRRRTLEQEFLDSRQDGFFEALALDDLEALNRWHDELGAYPEDVPRDFLAANILRTSGAFRERLIWLYRQWGYVERDQAQLMSRIGRHRLTALRRLYVVAGPEDCGLLMLTADEDYFTRILLAQILARVGEPEDIVSLLGDLRLEHSLMEEPIHSAIAQLDDAGLEGVFARRELIESVRIRRILLTIAAKRGVEGILGAVRVASRAFDPEVRIGACDAAVYLEPEEGAEILRHSVDDDSWEVRARAAKLLRGFPSLESFEVLVRATRDSSFWVRQNAAQSLRHMGNAGLLRLEGIAVTSDDDFAVDAAVQQLQQAELVSSGRRRLGRGEVAP